MSRWRRTTWALVAWNVLMILWTASYAGGVGDCAGESGRALIVCEAGRALGIQIGIPFILIVWLTGILVLGLIWLISRPSQHAPVQQSR